MANFTRRALLPFLLFWAVAALLQWRSGSWHAEFGAHDDEPAHYVTGLMVRDYLAQLAPGSPMEYARNYYLHYPKVAFGHWPPVFYLAQAAWTLPFGVSRESMLLFLALLSAVLAFALYRTLRPVVGTAGAIGAGALLLTLPLAQEYGRVMMSDLLQALLYFLAALALARYFREPDWKSSAAFGVAAAAAILNKGTGITLAVLPVLMLLMTHRFRLSVKPSLWLSAVIVVAAAAPWYLFAPAAMHQSAVPLSYVVASPEFTPRFHIDWLWQTGMWLVPLAVIGILERVLVPLVTGKRVDPLWASAAGLMIAVLGFRSLTPLMSDTRHALPAVPPFLMFAAAGTRWLLARLPGGVQARWKPAAVAVVLVAAMVMNADAMRPKEESGFIAVASDLVANPDLKGSVFLIASDAIGEGMFIEEVAMREKRPGHIVLRASKALSESGWMGEGYSCFFDTPEELMDYLESVPVGVLVLEEDASPDQAHQRLLKQVVRQYADRWKRIGTYPGRGGLHPGEEGIDVYELIGHQGRPVDETRIAMKPPR